MNGPVPCSEEPIVSAGIVRRLGSGSPVVGTALACSSFRRPCRFLRLTQCFSAQTTGNREVRATRAESAFLGLPTSFLGVEPLASHEQSMGVGERPVRSRLGDGNNVSPAGIGKPVGRARPSRTRGPPFREPRVVSLSRVGPLVVLPDFHEDSSLVPYTILPDVDIGSPRPLHFPHT